MNSKSLYARLLAALIFPASSCTAGALDTVSAPGETLVATVHAQGAQIYECKTGTSEDLIWQFREPVATLFEAGNTVGRHYAGPSWELVDGSSIIGKVVARAPGASVTDIPLLRLDVTARQGDGRLAAIDTIQRLNTKGGVATGPCATAGELLSVPYSADYAFLKTVR